MTEQDLEQALRRALKPMDPGEDFSDRVVAHLDATTAEHVRSFRLAENNLAMLSKMAAWRQLSVRRASITLAACAIAGIGLIAWKHQAVQRQRGIEARAQLMQALGIASAKVNDARAAVIREEEWVE